MVRKVGVFWLLWVLATSITWTVSWQLAFWAQGAFVSALVEAFGSAPPILTEMFAVIFVGIAVGLGQFFVLSHYGYHNYFWWLLTGIGLGLGYAVGFWLYFVTGRNLPVMALAWGAMLGFWQWLVIRLWVKGHGVWVFTTAVALSFAFLSTQQQRLSPLWLNDLFLSSVYSAISGLALVWLLGNGRRKAEMTA